MGNDVLVDSHCHLNLINLGQVEDPVLDLVTKARSAGVIHLLSVATDLENSKTVIEIAERFADVSASVGVHPSEQLKSQLTEEVLISLGQHPKVVAIGETGLDYFHNDSELEEMRDRFRIQIRAAKWLNKPLIIHSRNAPEDTLTIMKTEEADRVGGVMHCFTESLEMAEAAMALGFYISISGIVTFKNAKNVVAVAERVPMDRLLIETDSPFLAPVPFRGKQNEPQYVRHVAEKIAEIKGVTFSEIAHQTTENFFKLFKYAIPGDKY